MRVYCLDRRYGIDQPEVAAFMQQHSFSAEAIARFSVHIRERCASPKKHHLGGEFKLPAQAHL